MTGKAAKKDCIATEVERGEEPRPADAFELENAIGFLVRRLNSLASALFAETSEQTEVTAMQMGVLITIYQARCIPLPELSRRMRVDRSTLQELVSRLLNRGILARRNAPHDKRVHELWLTDAGTAIVDRHLEAARRMEARLLDGLSPKQAVAVINGIKAILAHHDF